MVPFIVLVVSFLMFAALGWLGVAPLAGWVAPLRFALALMLLLTASAHWGRRRPDLVRMVPPGFPAPEALVTLTGVLELAAAVGLLIPALARWAGLGLALLLVAMFPANVHAARARVAIGGRPATPLLLRTVLQLVFIAAAVAVAFGA